jgi:hypothetical protein
MKKAAAIAAMISLLAFAAPAADLRADIEVSLVETEISTGILTNLSILSLPVGDASEPLALKASLDPSSVALNPGHRYLIRSLEGSAFGKTAFDASLIAMVGLNVADYLSTTAALKYPGLAEGNPLLKPFVKSPAAFAAVKLGFTAVSYFSAKSLFKRNKVAAWFVTMAANAALGYAVSNNVKLIGMAGRI